MEKDFQKRKLGHSLSVLEKRLKENDKTTYTVDCDPKIDKLNEKSKEKSPKWLSVLKWVSTIVMFFVSLFCLCASKISFIYVAQHLQGGSERRGHHKGRPGLQNRFP